MPADGEPVILRQIGGDRIRVELGGEATPDRPVEDTSERSDERWLTPGGPVGRHALTSDRGALPLRGTLRIREDGPTPERTARQIERLLHDAVPVRLTWGDVWTRDGFVESVTLRRHSDARIDYEIGFQPDATDDAPRSVQRPSQARPAVLSTALTLDEQVAVARAVQIALVAVSAARLATLTAVNVARAAVTGSLPTLQQVGERLARAVAPTEAEAVASLVREGIEAAEQARASVDAVPAASLTTIDATDTARLQAWYSDSQSAMVTSIGAMRRAVQALGVLERGEDRRRTHVVSSGDTVTSLSIRYYETPDRAGEIEAANGLAPGEPLTAGTQITIPRIGGGRSAAPADGEDLSGGPIEGIGWDVYVTADGDAAAVTGPDALDQWVRRAALTSPGALIDDPAWGGGLAGAIGAQALPAEVAADIRATLLSDDRITSVETVATADDDGTLTVRIDYDSALSGVVRSEVTP